MNHPIINILKDIETQLLNCQIDSSPFPHIVLNIPIDKSTLDNIKEDRNPAPMNLSIGLGRTEYNFSLNQNEWHIIDNISHLIIDKLNVNLPKLTSENRYMVCFPHVVFWSDTSELDISDIHLDYLVRTNNEWECTDINESTQTVFSMQIYLPEDNTHSDLGTSLYLVPNDVNKIISDYPVTVPSMVSTRDVSKCTKVKQIPFIPGNAFIHASSLNSWHQAPKIPEGYIRESIMIRWEYTLIKLKSQRLF